MRELQRSILYFVTLVTLYNFAAVTAQTTVVNAQAYTNGLAIIDAPAAQNPGHAGSNIPVAIDVSGNGKLAPTASLPGSNLSTSFTLLEIYLVSAATNINMTVSSGAGLLQRENGSTVKHLDWVIPTCVPVGNYNLTFYETSTVDSQPVFTITAVPIPISNGSPSGACSDNSTVAPTLNTLQPRPQAAHPLAQSPFVGANNGTATGSSVGITTFSVGPGTLVLPLVLVAFGTLL